MNSVEQIVTKIEEFSPGDLVTGIEISELFEEILKDKNIDKSSKTLINEFSSEFQGVIQQTNKEADSILSGIKKGLKKIFKIGNKKNKKETIKKQSKVVEDLEVLISFIAEAQEHLEHIEDKILSLEHTSNDDIVNDIFRSIHTIKGVASFLALDKIKTLGHSMETLLDDLRMKKVSVTAALIDVLLAGADCISNLVSDLNEQVVKIDTKNSKNTEIIEADVDSDKIITQLEEFQKNKNITQANAKKKETGYQEELITDEMLKKFGDESLDMIDSIEKILLDLEGDKKKQGSINEAFRLVHTIKGNAGFFWFPQIEKKCMAIESAFDDIRKNKKSVESKLLSALLKQVDSIRTDLTNIQKGLLKPGDASNSKVENEIVPQLGEILVEMGAVSKEDIDKALDMQNMKLGELLVDQGTASEDSVKKAVNIQSKKLGLSSEEMSKYTIKRKDIRVDTTRLDQLFDLMGELITAEAMVLHNPDFQGLELPNFQKSSAYLSKITREMQEITMSIRMIPLEGLFKTR